MCTSGLCFLWGFWVEGVKWALSTPYYLEGAKHSDPGYHGIQYPSSAGYRLSLWGSEPTVLWSLRCQALGFGL